MTPIGWDSAGSPVLLTVAKRPEPGRAKTRLHDGFTPEEAAMIYHSLLLDTFRLMAQVSGVRPVVAFTPDDADGFFRALVPPHFDLLAQRGRDLGERLPNALGHFLDGPGAQRAVIMNSDGPTLPVAYLEQAFDALGKADVVLGPGTDGGYYLIGMSRLHRGLFEKITWSTDLVVGETLARARSLGLSVHLLPTWYDVDVAADLRRILADGAEAAPETYATVARLRPSWVA
jgi:rSAM/selenodomain-associated transferase 1